MTKYYTVIGVCCICGEKALLRPKAKRCELCNRKKLAVIQGERREDAEYRKKLKSQHDERMQNTAYREKKRDSQRERRKDPENRKKENEKKRELYQRKKKNTDIV